jgi:zinc protease
MVCAAQIPNPFPPGSVVSLPPLSNGLRIVLRENHAQPIVAMEVVIRSGAAAEADMPGVAHFLEHVSFEGSEHFPDRFGPQYALESVGGLSNAVTRRDVIRYNGAVASDQAPLLATVLADIVLHPLLADASLVSQRPVISMEYDHQMLDPVTALVNTAYQATFPGQPYGVAPVGTMEDIQRVTPAMVRDFHRHWFTPNNMTVVLVGDITMARAQSVVQAAFGDARSAILPAVAPMDYRFHSEAVTIHLAWSLPTTYQVMVFSAPSATDFKQFVATQVLASLLINSDDALLPARWADAGLHLGQFGQEYVGSKYPGRLLIWAQTLPADADSLFKTTCAALVALRQTLLPAQNLSRAKSALTLRFLHDNATYSDQAATLAFYASLGDEFGAENYLSAVQTVTDEDVRAQAPKSYLARITLGGE